MAGARKTDIRIGTKVTVKETITIVSFDDISLKVRIGRHTVTVSRFISALGQYLPGYNWEPLHPMAIMEEDFYYTGRYVLDNKLYVAEQYSQADLDKDLHSLISDEFDGSVLWGVVVAIYTMCLPNPDHVLELMDEDYQYYSSVREAQLDPYTVDVFAIIQDPGSSAEYSLNINLLKPL